MNDDDIVEALRRSVEGERLENLEDVIERSIRAVQRRLWIRRGTAAGVALVLVVGLGTLLHLGTEQGRRDAGSMLARSDRVLAVGRTELSARLGSSLPANGRAGTSPSDTVPNWLASALHEPASALRKYAYTGVTTYHHDSRATRVGIALQRLDATNLESLRAGDCVQDLPEAICVDFARHRHTDSWGIIGPGGKTSVRVFSRITDDGWLIQVVSHGANILTDTELRTLTNSTTWLRSVPAAHSD